MSEFTSFQSKDGKTISVRDIKPVNLWLANGEYNSERDSGYDITPYILMQIVSINGVDVNLERLNNLHIEDYMQITQIVDVILTKLKV